MPNNCGRLVLTLQEGEEIVIGPPSNPIGTVGVGEIKAGRATVVCRFPRDIAVNRGSVARRMMASRPPVVGTIRPAG